MQAAGETSQTSQISQMCQNVSIRHVQNGQFRHVRFSTKTKTRPGPRLGEGEPEQRQKRHQKRHPRYTHWYPPGTPCIPHVPTWLPGYTMPATVSTATAPGRDATPRLAMGLTFRNFQYCTNAIQRRVLRCLKSDCRSALGLVNRSACSSSLDRYIKKIGHVRFK